MKVHEFRSNLKTAFNKAIQEPVYIERGGLVFELKVKGSILTSNLKDMVLESVIEDSDGLIMRASEIERVRECKNGHSIPEGRDKCLGKGCKYS